MPESDTQFDISHPAPARETVPQWRVAFGLLGAPVAWSLQLGGGAAIGGLACLAPESTRLGTGAGGTVTALVAINLAALALAAAAFIVSYVDLRRTRREEHHRSGGVMIAGEGRTRFLSVAGSWISAMFLIATLASTISILWRTACPA